MDGVIGWNQFRNYEVSVWTLQDSFIATLKSGDPIILNSNAGSPAMVWPQARAQGQIQNGQMEIDIDGTLKLSFDIPMYIYYDGKRIDNPNWYNAVNKNILTSMRKIKIIFNKWQQSTLEERSASTFEFIILKVLETHESDNLMCHVECEGLAFHELGKIGYKRALSAQGFLDDYYNWSLATVGSEEGCTYSTKADKNRAKPIANIDYWMTNANNGANIEPLPRTSGEINFDVLNPNAWYYEVRMTHSSMVHDTNVTSHKIYEESFPDSWNADGTKPLHYMKFREKARIVDLKESNLYNITLDLAEKFEVFCRYEYLYDLNYNIIGRVIIFYNNFLHEDKGVDTLMYPNSASKIMREMDSTDVSTKMFVRSVDADDLYYGTIDIMDCTANKSREDYLLNFNYLYEIGTIGKELYKAIKTYESDMRKLNNKMFPLLDAKSNLDDLKIELDAKISNLTESIALDLERITENAAYILALDSADGDNDGFITRDYRNPATLSLLKDSSKSDYDTYYVLFNERDDYRGILPETLKLYKKYLTTATKTYEYGFNFKGWSKKGGYLNYNKIEIYSSKTRTHPTTGGTKIVIDYPLTYKGTYGTASDKADVLHDDASKREFLTTELPPPSDNNKGWIYRNINVTNEGRLYLSDGTTWNIFDPGSGLDKKSGFFIFKKTILHLINGLVSESATATRYGCSNSSLDSVKSLLHVYYVTDGDAAPSKPIIATATTSETPIANKNVIKEWSTYFSTPDDLTTVDSYHAYGSWRLAYTKGSIIYTEPAEVTYDAVGYNEDVNKRVTWRKLVKGAANSFLKQEDEITGTFVYDEYHNLDKVIGLFRRKKEGSYYSYTTIANNSDNLIYYYKTKNSISEIDSNDTEANKIDKNKDNVSHINTLASNLSSLSGYSSTFPSDIKDKFVIIKQTNHHSNGNITYSYSIKYYNSSGVADTPSGTNTNMILDFKPIFYLKTTTTAPPKFGVDSVLNTDGANNWTTALPNKTDKDWKYYSGWAIRDYAGITKYYVNGEDVDNSLKKAKTTGDDTSDLAPKYIYATFKYKPDWYYENIKLAWINKLNIDLLNLDKHTERLALIKNLITELEAKIEEYRLKKKDNITKFELMMGAALRESYWQPEDEYQDYGSRYEEEIDLPLQGLFLSGSTFFKSKTKLTNAYFGWDILKFDEEDELYYETGVDREKVYYPCIDLSQLSTTRASSDNNHSFLTLYKNWTQGANLESPFAFIFNPAGTALPTGTDDDNTGYDFRYCLYFTVGSLAKLALVKTWENNIGVIKPVLVLIGASSLSEDELLNLYTNGVVGRIFPTEEGEHVHIKMRKNSSYNIPLSAWINVLKNGDKWKTYTKELMAKYKIVYPRILIPSLKLKTNTKDLTVYCNDKELTKFEHYYLLTQTYYKSTLENYTLTVGNNNFKYVKRKFIGLEKVNKEFLDNIDQFGTFYTITLKPEYLFSILNFNTSNLRINIDVYYTLSNADIDIYLDAKKILKENAYPKVAYEIEVSRWSPDLLKNIYTKLAQIVMINDTDLKLQDTFGYISNIKLDLDHEEKDSVEVKNYKTKFEDLFSKIVAETEEMHKNSYNIGLAGAIASGDGASVKLDVESVKDMLADASIQDVLLDFLKNYFDGPEVVQSTLKDMWDEAGLILGSAASSLTSVMNLTMENATILAGFRENVAAAMTPKVFYGTTLPTDFKPGDIWINDLDGYLGVATGYGGQGGGFTRTRDGTLAEISGASMNIDADAGIIDILAQTEINLKSGKNIYIAADDTIDIIGNKTVNIGGTTINMASLTITGDNYPVLGVGGIHLVSSEYTVDTNNNTADDDEVVLREDSTSLVNIHGDGIELASKKGIIIKSGEGIKIYSSNQNNDTAIDADHGTAAVKINATEGIWLGSNKPLKLYSGDVVLNDDGSINNGSTGANIELSSKHLLLGVANVVEGNATAIELSDKLIILAAGENLKNMPKNADGTVNINKIAEADIALAGVQIKSDYIGMAVGLNVVTNNEWTSKRSLISIESGKIKLGTMRLVNTNKRDDPTGYDGEYIWMADNDFYIGGMGNFTLNTNNIKIQSKNLSDAKGTNENNVNGMGFALGMNLLGNSPEVGLGFWVKKNTDGNTTTYEKHLMVDGDITALTFVASRTVNGTTYKLRMNSSGMGFYKGSNALLTITSEGKILASEDFTISTNKILTLNGADLSVNISNEKSGADRRIFTIDTTNMKSTSDDPNSTLIMYCGSGWSTATSGMRFNIKNGLEVKGALTATTLTVGSGNNYMNFDGSTLTVKGALTATSLTVGTDTAAMTYSSSAGLKIGSGNNLLTYKDSTLTVKGALTATSLAVGTGTAAMTYSSSNGLAIGSGNNSLTYTSSGLVVKGNITATSGSIGNWIIEKSTDTKKNGRLYCGRDTSGNATQGYIVLNPNIDTTDTDNGGGFAIRIGVSNGKTGTKVNVPFGVSFDGAIVFSSLYYYSPDANKRGVAHTIRQWEKDSNGYATFIKFDNGDTVNFKNASAERSAGYKEGYNAAMKYARDRSQNLYRGGNQYVTYQNLLVQICGTQVNATPTDYLTDMK